MIRRLWPLLLGALAFGWMLVSFDWSLVGAALRRFELGHLLAIGVPASLIVFAARSLRWAAVAGLPFAPGALWRSHVHTTMAIAVATATPLQAAEAMKLKFAHDAHGIGYARLGAAFGMERLADLAAILGIGALGFGLRGAAFPWLLAAALGIAAMVAAAPWGLRRLVALPLPDGFRRHLIPLADYRLAGWRLQLLGLCTAVKWGAVVVLWQATFAAAGIGLGLTDCALVVALVTLSVTASLVPGGIGIAEVSTRAVLVWLGVEAGAAEAGAVMLRLQMPLFIVIGLSHGVFLMCGTKAARHG